MKDNTDVLTSLLESLIKGGGSYATHSIFSLRRSYTFRFHDSLKWRHSVIDYLRRILLPYLLRVVVSIAFVWDSFEIL